MWFLAHWMTAEVFFFLSSLKSGKHGLILKVYMCCWDKPFFNCPIKSVTSSENVYDYSTCHFTAKTRTDNFLRLCKLVKVASSII